jgi:predicted  nucleic acid-binding Zn-ribbon protein
MATERIETLISKEALAQFDELNAKLGISITGFEKLIAKAVETNKALGGAKTFKQVVDGTKELEQAEKDLAKQKFELEKQQAKLNSLYSEEAKRIAELKVQQQQRNQQIKEEIQLNQAAEGSIKQKQVQLKQLQRDYDSLSEAERNAAKGTALLENIQKLDKELKDLEGSTGRFQRNVGNYQGSAKIIVDALEKARQKFEGLKKSADSTPAALERAKSEFEALRGITDNKQFLNFSGKMGDATQEVRTFTRTLVNLETQGLGNSEVANDLRKRLAELTDQIADTRAEVKALASDTRAFDLFASSISFAANVFQTAAGAAVAFGASEKDAAEAAKTLLAIENISNGVRGIANELTTKGTAANKLYEFSQKQIATAFDTSATAGARFRAALISLGIGAIIVGIGLLIANFDKLKKALSGLSKEQQLSKEISDKAVEGFIKEKVAVEVLAAEAVKETTSKRRKLEIIKELNDISPRYFNGIKTEKDLQEKATEAVKKYVEAISIKAKAQAATEILAEKEKLIVLRQIELERQYESIKTENFGSEQKRQQYLLKFRKLIDEGRDAELQALQKEADPARKVIADLKAQLDNLGGDPSGVVKNITSISKTFNDELLKSEADNFRKLSQLQEAHLITRIGARQKAFDIEKQILSAQRAVEIGNINGQIADENSKADKDINQLNQLNAKKADVERDFAVKRVLLERQLGEDLLSIRQSFIEQQRQQDKEANESFIRDQQEAFNKQIEQLQHLQDTRSNNLSEGQEEELKSLNKWYEQRVNATAEGSVAREKVEEKYAQRRADIEYRYALAALKTQIEFAEKILAARKAAGLDVVNQEKQLHELRISLSDLEANRNLENNKRKAKSDREYLTQLEKSIGQVNDIYSKSTELISGFLSATTDSQKAAIQEQIEAVGKKQEKDIEVVNASAISEQEKADKIAIINARAAAQKEALERRQRQLDLQKAKFDKAANIGKIIVETALAVVHQLNSGDPYTAVARAIAVGAIGAAQLATAIAAPLPKFATGTDDAPGGLAWVGDAHRSELMVTPQGELIETPSVPTVMNVPKHSIIFPDSKQALRAIHNQIGFTQSPSLLDNGRYYREMTKTLGGKLDRLDKTIRGKKEIHIHRSRDGWKMITKSGGNSTHYLNDNLQG